MKRQTFSTGVVLAILIFSVVSYTLPVYSQTKLARLAYTTGHGEITQARLPSVGPDLANMIANLTKIGFAVVEIKGKITPESLANVDFFIVGHIFGKNFEYTDAEVAAVKAWFNQGRKTLWITGDSDFGEADYINVNSNKILEAVGSKLRFDYGTVDDPVSNAGAPYRVVGSLSNTKDPEVKDIVQGVQKALFHGPTMIVAVTSDGKWVDMRQTKVENVFWVLASSENSVITDNHRPPAGIAPKVYQSGQTGSFVLVAVEKFAGEKKNSKIIASAESPYGSYEPMYKSAYITAKQLDGPTFVLNLITWGSLVEELSPLVPTEVLVGIAVVIVVAAVAIYRVRSKPKMATPTQPATQ